MDGEALLWVKAGHVFGFMMWVGSLIGSCHVLKAHKQAGQDPNQAFTSLERGLGMAMDIGATIAIVAGGLLLFLPPAGLAIFKAGGFFHVKLTFVGVLLASHVFLRLRLSRGSPAGIPAFVFPAIQVSVLIIIAMIVARPF